MSKNNYLLAIASGLLLAVGWPTYGFPILLFVAFVPLLVVEKRIRLGVQKKKGLKVFITSYITFVTWNAITTWWLWYSTPFGMFFAILVNSLLMALVFLFFHHIARRLPSKIHLLFLVLIWISFEKFHLNWDFSWPWLNLGNAFSEVPSWIQWYEYTGVFGGSLWIWLVNIGVFKFYETYRPSNNKRKRSIEVAKLVLYVAIPIIISNIIYINYKTPSKTVTVLLLQPNVDPYTEKFDRENIESALELVSMVQKEVSSEVDFVIAPETALARLTPIDQFDYTKEKKALQSLTEFYPNLNILTGVDFYKLYLKEKEKPTKTANKTSRGDWVDYYNAAVLINKNTTAQSYIKSKLVVGVETFPFKNILEPLLGDIMLDLGGTISARGTQKERVVFNSIDKEYKAAPVICYESIYGEFVTDYIKEGANFLAIITNDAWWDNTEGHKQHLSYAKLRAIETRRSIARSANTGISAFINQKGEVVKKLDYGLKGSIQSTIAVNTKQTFYVTYGDFIARIAVLLSALIALYAFAIKRGAKKSLSSVK